MRTSRTVKSSQLPDYFSAKAPSDAKRNEQNRLIVPVYSEFFSGLTDNVMYTNSMFENLKKEIDDSVSLYSSKEDIVLTVYESSSVSDENIRESALIGFKKYIQLNKQKAVSRLKTHLFTFLLFFVIGVLMEYLLYGAFPAALPGWVESTLDVFACVFVWQFVAYMAFEFEREITNIRRFTQILRMEFVFRHWE